MRNDFKPGQTRLQQEAIMSGILAKAQRSCPTCGAATTTWSLKAHTGCTGQVCRSCGWEGEPQYRMVNGTCVPVGGCVAGDVR